MPQGIVTYNDLGRLSFASDGLAPVLIGYASYQGTVASPVGDGTAGYSIFTIDYSGDQIIVDTSLATASNDARRILNYSKSGTTWTIHVMRGAGSVNSAGFTVESTTSETLRVYGLPTSVSSAGAAIYNSSGQLVGDLGQLQLIIAGWADFAANGMSASISGRFYQIPDFGNAIVPSLIGQPLGYRKRTAWNNDGTYSIREYICRPYTDSGRTTLYRAFHQHTRTTGLYNPDYVGTGGGVLDEDTIEAQTILLMDGGRFLLA